MSAVRREGDPRNAGGRARVDDLLRRSAHHGAADDVPPVQRAGAALLEVAATQGNARRGTRNVQPYMRAILRVSMNHTV